VDRKESTARGKAELIAQNPLTNPAAKNRPRDFKTFASRSVTHAISESIGLARQERTENIPW